MRVNLILTMQKLAQITIATATDFTTRRVTEMAKTSATKPVALLGTQKLLRTKVQDGHQR